MTPKPRNPGSEWPFSFTPEQHTAHIAIRITKRIGEPAEPHGGHPAFILSEEDFALVWDCLYPEWRYLDRTWNERDGTIALTIANPKEQVYAVRKR